MISMYWSDLSHDKKTDLLAKIFINELKMFHFTGESDSIVHDIVQLLIDRVSKETKYNIGQHVDLLLKAYATDSVEHTRPGRGELLPDNLLYIDNKYVNISDAEQAYIRHMIHALCNNIILLLMIGSSTLHSIMPKVQPFWCVERLIQLFVNMRLHTPKDMLTKCYGTIIKNMKRARDERALDPRRDLGFVMFQSLIKEKDILEQLLPSEFDDKTSFRDKFKILISRVNKYKF